MADCFRFLVDIVIDWLNDLVDDDGAANARGRVSGVAAEGKDDDDVCIEDIGENLDVAWGGGSDNEERRMVGHQGRIESF